MAEKTTTAIIRTADGTEIAFDSWLKDAEQVIMVPGRSQFQATCPQHGPIAGSYEALTVGFAVGDHATDHHGGLQTAADITTVVPAIQL